MLGYRDGGAEEFRGPARGSGAEPDLRRRACWALALLTEVYRRGPEIAAVGPSVGCLTRPRGRCCWLRLPTPGLTRWPRSAA
jgi:hypothetical protein